MVVSFLGFPCLHWNRSYFGDTYFKELQRAAVFDSLIDDPDWKGHLWTNAYLAGKCNEEVVRVEVRQEGMRGFGRGVETST